MSFKKSVPIDVEGITCDGCKFHDEYKLVCPLYDISRHIVKDEFLRCKECLDDEDDYNKVPPEIFGFAV